MTNTINIQSYGPIRNLFIEGRRKLVNCGHGVIHPVKPFCHYADIICVSKALLKGVMGTKTLVNTLLSKCALTLGILNQHTGIIALGLYSMTLHKIVDGARLIFFACTSLQFFKTITQVLERMTVRNFCHYCRYCIWVFHEMESYNLDERRKLRTTTRNRNWWSRRLHTQ